MRKPVRIQIITWYYLQTLFSAPMLSEQYIEKNLCRELSKVEASHSSINPGIPSGQKVSKWRVKHGSGHKISSSDSCLQVNCHRRDVRTRREEKRSGVNWSLSPPPILGQKYLSLLLYFLLQHHLSLHLSMSKTLQRYVRCEAMTGCCLKTDEERRKIWFSWDTKAELSSSAPLLFFFLNKNWCLAHAPAINNNWIYAGVHENLK